MLKFLSCSVVSMLTATGWAADRPQSIMHPAAHHGTENQTCRQSSVVAQPPPEWPAQFVLSDMDGARMHQYLAINRGVGIGTRHSVNADGYTIYSAVPRNPEEPDAQYYARVKKEGKPILHAVRNPKDCTVRLYVRQDLPGDGQ